jgi:hypothetical protein
MEYYFLYCTTHDDGRIETKYKLENINCMGTCNNVDCTFIYNGMVKVDGENIIEINKIRRDYDRFGGGFKFEYYKNYCNTNSKLYKWIEKIS